MDQGSTTASDDFHARASVLRALALQKEPQIEEALRIFGSEEQLLLAVHQHWQVHLLARLDMVVELGSDDPHRDVLRAVEELGRAMPGLAALLRAHADDPVLDRARRRLAAYVDQACPCGRSHPLVPASRQRRATSRCAVRRAMAARWRRHLACAAGALHPHGALRA